MIGAGRVGKNHARAITRHVPAGKIVSLVDPMETVRLETAAEFGIEASYASLEQALEGEAFEAVVITTPTPTHLPLTELAASHGKHVFLEKPMALNLQECDAINAAVGRHAVILQIGFMRRFDPEFTAACAAHRGRRDWPTHDDQIQYPRARSASRPGRATCAPQTACWLRSTATIGTRVRWLMGSNLERVYTEVANFKGPANNVDTPHFYDNVLVNIRFESGGLGMHLGDVPVRLRLRCAGGDRWRERHHADWRAAGSGSCGLHQPRSGFDHSNLPHLARAVRLGLYLRDGAFRPV